MKFRMDLPEDLLNLSRAFHAAGHQLYVVGGSVRDALQGKDPKDYDVATDAVPDEVVEILKGMTGNKILEVGKSFGVIVCITPEGGEYEIATFREDVGKGRRPDAVEFTSIENDVKRRDLTMNALFYDIDEGEVVDFVGGIDDIKNGIVKAVGDPAERFDEDRLRILRAIRFAVRMGAKLDPATDAAIIDNNNLMGVSPERIRDEFLKAFKSARSINDLTGMIAHYRLWDQVLPRLSISDKGVEGIDDAAVFLAVLLRQNDPQVVAKVLNGLKYSAQEAAQVSFLVKLQDLAVENAYRLKKAAQSARVTDDQVKEFASSTGKPTDRMVAAFIAYAPSVHGNDLIAAGYSGAALGKELERQETELFGRLVGA